MSIHVSIKIQFKNIRAPHLRDMGKYHLMKNPLNHIENTYPSAAWFLYSRNMWTALSYSQLVNIST